ncbi:hypothetical protein [Arthrobacter sp. JSM 101049]|uniref:hypothetical protein n=1 Tax=Arthrobacter sp. JSM 101049 TaxID=929097 RepID=UPI00356AEBD5
MATIDGARWRAVANWLNLATPCGLLLARASGCRVVDGGRGLHFALGYRPRLPVAAAFTVGNVVLFRGEADASRRPGLVDHEARHCTQYALCLGLPFLPLYALAAGYSWLRTGDPASRNVFERRAGLADGGYRERPPRPLRPVLARFRPGSRPRG